MLYSSSKLRDKRTARHVKSRMLSLTALPHTSEGGLTTVFGFLDTNESLMRIRASLVAQLIKNPPATQKTWVRSLGWENPAGEGNRTHSGILACRIP